MAIATAGVTDRLADYALTLEYDQIPAQVIDRTKQLFLDFLGVAFGGREVADSTDPVIKGVSELSRGATGSSTVLGEKNLYPPHYAALLNATMAHSMDFDDTHRESILHPGTPLFSTLLALAEETGASGIDFLTAAVAGYDIGNKLGKAHGSSMHDKGFHPTATTGIFACTAAGARIMKLSHQQAANAMGLNNSQTAGTQQFLVNGAWNKRLHTGLAAHNAILSLVMARHGFLGAAEPIEGKYGYFALYGTGPLQTASALDGLGHTFEVMHTALKPYPCCRYSHGVIDAVTGLSNDHGLSSDDIEAMEIELGPTGYEIVANPPDFKKRPATVVEGQFSVYFAAAVAALGPYSWDSYELLGSPPAVDLMDRTAVSIDGRLKEMESRTTVVTRDGRRLTRDVPLPKGEPENPMSWEEMEAKFTYLAEKTLGAEKARKITLQVGELERLGTMAELTRNLRG